MGGVGMGRLMGEQDEAQKEGETHRPKRSRDAEAQGHRGAERPGERAQECLSAESHRDREPPGGSYPMDS